MKGQFISLETAKLIKEKGLKIKSDKVYQNMTKNGKNYRLIDNQPLSSDLYINLDPKDNYNALSQPSFQKWLNDEFNIWIHVEKHYKDGLVCYRPFINNNPVSEDPFFNDFDSPEEAYEKAFKEVLRKLK